jgi:hypothetical protein
MCFGKCGVAFPCKETQNECSFSTACNISSNRRLVGRGVFKLFVINSIKMLVRLISTSERFLELCMRYL